MLCAWTFITTCHTVPYAREIEIRFHNVLLDVLASYEEVQFKILPKYLLVHEGTLRTPDFGWSLCLLPSSIPWRDEKANIVLGQYRKLLVALESSALRL